MKAAMLTSFRPEEVKIITDAYALALKAFEATGPLSEIHKDALAREIVTLAEGGCLETQLLADQAIIRARDVTPFPSRDTGSSRAGSH
jgi:hypothetical protein